MRLFDLVLALLILAALVAIARREFPSYETRSFVPHALEPAPTPETSPAP